MPTSERAEYASESGKSRVSYDAGRPKVVHLDGTSFENGNALADQSNEYATKMAPQVEVSDVKVRGRVMATEGDLTTEKIAASEARSDTKVVRLEGKIDTAVATLLGEMRAIRDDVRQADQYNRDSRLVILGAIIASVLALGGLAVGLATYGDALFGRGMNVRDVIQTTIKDFQDTQKKTGPTQAPPN